ncbi:SycD/LcrH family type III secretion system chaperone [Vibrio sp. S4M6]|uniref:SycD/LcrH family type III secretion system chaperone n=1 Tax=Vibrio sinus TaxID=2946865 RepID=UPI00202A26BF|nr:SycD/LcrH family type III secretion system chaperone [Vibrio sinus]MCL9783338.1 SycD/LcrH family type III secretion system chaperone [Vibrio sinus]
MSNVEELSRFCQQVLEQGKTLAEMRDISAQELENIYSRGFDYYQQGDYTRALDDFSYLVIHNPWDRRFYIALGSTLQNMKQYREALSFFGLALFMDSCDPTASYRIAQCLIELRETVSARDALQTAIQQSYSDPKHTQIRNMANRLLSTL